MADAKLCDRCGEFYVEIGQPRVKGLIVRSKSSLGYIVDEDVDLCEQCAKEFKSWVNREE